MMYQESNITKELKREENIGINMEIGINHQTPFLNKTVIVCHKTNSICLMLLAFK